MEDGRWADKCCWLDGCCMVAGCRSTGTSLGSKVTMEKGGRLAEKGGLEVLLEPEGVSGSVGPLRVKREEGAVPLWLVTLDGRFP
jgi:hypothetical protein